jgi:hypothetical protein
MMVALLPQERNRYRAPAIGIKVKVWTALSVVGASKYSLLFLALPKTLS